MYTHMHIHIYIYIYIYIYTHTHTHSHTFPSWLSSGFSEMIIITAKDDKRETEQESTVSPLGVMEGLGMVGNHIRH